MSGADSCMAQPSPAMAVAIGTGTLSWRTRRGGPGAGAGMDREARGSVMTALWDGAAPALLLSLAAPRHAASTSDGATTSALQRRATVYTTSSGASAQGAGASWGPIRRGVWS